MNQLALCYICPRTRFAYFTEIPLSKQWGDDWDDAPYEHNAGDPYDSDSQSNTHKIVRLAWEGPYETPAERHGPNSPFSVKSINSGEIAWLTPNGLSSSKNAKPIFAGTTMVDFIKLVQEAGGLVYLPKELSELFGVKLDKPGVSGEMRVKVYSVLERAIEEGFQRGWNRAYKHVDDPDKNQLENEITSAILGEICEVFNFDD